MPTYPIDLLPPRDWQVFEGFCRDLMRAEWGESAQLHGRQGQGQDGVDVYAMSDGGYVAFQCKSKGQRSDAKLTPKEIEEDVQKAREFEPPLSKLIFATTAQRHKDTQATVRNINEAHPKEDPLELARKIVEETGYGRREREVRELSEALGVEAGP